jgi:hypothetical protein
MPLHHYQYQSRTLISIPPGLQQQQKQPACAWAHRPASHEGHGADRKKLPRSYITLSFVLRPCRHARLSSRWAAGLCALSVVFWHGAARTGTAVVVIVFAVDEIRREEERTFRGNYCTSFRVGDPSITRPGTDS